MNWEGQIMDPATSPEEIDPILKELDQFQLFRSPILRKLVVWIPWVMSFLLLADWLVGPGIISRDQLRFPAFIAIILELVLLNVLLFNVTDRLTELYVQGVIPANQEPINQAFARWLKQFQDDLVHSPAWIGGAILAVQGFGITYPALYLYETHKFPFDFWGMIRYYTYQNLALITPLAGFYIGLLFWRVGVVALNLYRLGNDVNLQVLPEHPDRCGGLRAAGDLCLQLALMMLVPAIFLAFWAVAVNYVPVPKDSQATFDFFVRNLKPIAQNWLLILVILGFFMFFQPLYSIHRRMQRRRKEIQQELAEIAGMIEKITVELRQKADQMTSAQIKEKLDQLESLQMVYTRSSSFPTWPFDAKQLAALGSAQLLPLLSLFGASDKIIAAIDRLLNLAH
jgi:hypothetical protein